MGVCELFCILFILYEIVSILKNMTLCGLPVPARLKSFIQKFLDDMTEELPEEVSEHLHKLDGDV
jgi:toxin secretion/phage lysis holin